MILTVPSLCVALFSSPIGAAADRWGRRPILLASLVAYGLFGLAPFLFQDIYSIIGSRFVVGIAEAAILTIGNALMGDYFAGTARQKWLGLQVSLGPFIGTAYILAGGALGNWSWHGPFLLYLMGLIVLAFAWVTLYEPPAAGRADGASAASPSAPAVAPFPWRVTSIIGGVTLLVSVIYFLQAVQHGRIFAELGVTKPSTISIVVSIASMGTVIGGLAYRSIGGWRVAALLALVFAGYGVGYLGVSRSPDYLVGMGFDAIGQFAGGLAIPVLIAWALDSYDYRHRGRGMGIWAACFFLGQFLSPPVVMLIGRLTPGFLPSVGTLGALSVGCAVFALVLGRRRPATA
jgi:MFS family permease